MNLNQVCFCLQYFGQLAPGIKLGQIYCAKLKKVAEMDNTLHGRQQNCHVNLHQRKFYSLYDLTTMLDNLFQTHARSKLQLLGRSRRQVQSPLYFSQTVLKVFQYEFGTATSLNICNCSAKKLIELCSSCIISTETSHVILKCTAGISKCTRRDKHGDI